MYTIEESAQVETGSKLDIMTFVCDLNLRKSTIESLGNLISVGGRLNLFDSNIKSLGNLESVKGGLDLRHSKIKSLGNLQSVGGNFNLGYSKIKSLGNLQSVGGYLDLRNTPLSETYPLEKEIRKQVKVEGDIYL